MKCLENLKNELGNGYCFQNHLPEVEVLKLLNASRSAFSEQTISSLEAGNLKIESVIFKVNGKPILGCDIFVKDVAGAAEWICYDNLTEDIRLENCVAELPMLATLDTFAENASLSYTKCNFEVINGKAKKKQDALTQTLV